MPPLQTTRILAVLLTALVTASCDGLLGVGDHYPSVRSSFSEAGLSAQTLAELSEQAAHLVLAHTSPDRIDIPGTYRDRYYRALIAMHRAAQSQEEVPVRVPKTRYYSELHQIFVSATTGESWIQNLMSLTSPTGYAAFDDLVSEYGLTIAPNHDIGPALPSVLLSSRDPLNMAALARRITLFPGVVVADIEYVMDFNANRMTGRPMVGYVELECLEAWGDCPSGCIYHHTWRYRVYDSGLVQLRDEWGDPYP